MMLRFAQKERPHELASAHTMATRLCIANSSAIHQTSYAVTNVLLDLVAADGEFGTMASLRDELAHVFGPAEHHGGGARATAAQWTKANIQNLRRADSVCCESLRLHTFPQRFMPRRVQSDDLETPGGHHLPRGTVVTFFSGPVHRDAEHYADPLKYDPWRFSRQREKDGGAGAGVGAEGLSLVSLSSAFYSFGRGRHACSGRALVDYELKMIIAYLVLNYDLRLPDKCGGCRPRNAWAAEVQFPPEGQTILVRRRVK